MCMVAFCACALLDAIRRERRVSSVLGFSTLGLFSLGRKQALAERLWIFSFYIFRFFKFYCRTHPLAQSGRLRESRALITAGLVLVLLSFLFLYGLLELNDPMHLSSVILTCNLFFYLIICNQ